MKSLLHLQLRATQNIIKTLANCASWQSHPFANRYMNNMSQWSQPTEQSRDQFLASVANLTFAHLIPTRGQFSPSQHIVRAEQSGVMGMWKALDGIRQGAPVWSGEPVHRGLSMRLRFGAARYPISGPLDVRQRLEFLRFHLDRHRAQVEQVKLHPDFPLAN